MIKVTQALSIILASLKAVKAEYVDTISSLNRFIAEDIYAEDNLPPFDNSAMDGYALKTASTKKSSRKNPRLFKVINTIPAGYLTSSKVSGFKTIRIMTGAPVPQGADGVVMKEETALLRKGKEEFITIFREIEKGENIRKAGEDVKRGEKVITKGSLIRPAELGMLAALGLTKIKMAKKPRVGILSTGDELIDINERPTLGKIRNSNSYCLYGQVVKSGGIPLDLGLAKDNLKDIYSKIKRGLKSNLDMLLISGGVSVGDYDFVNDALKKLGAEIKFWKVAMRPGRPLAFGLINKIPVFGLPGNPVSIMVSFEEFVRSAILKMQGAKKIFLPRISAVSKVNLDKRPGVKYFLRVKLENKNGVFYASLTGPQGSGILKSMLLAEGIMVLPEEMRELKKGQKVEVQLLD